MFSPFELKKKHKIKIFEKIFGTQEFTTIKYEKNFKFQISNMKLINTHVNITKLKKITTNENSFFFFLF
jgi:hypothetical protein